MKVVQTYGQASGQCINNDKSSILFGKDIPEVQRQQVKAVLGIHNEGGMGSYLGIPEDISGSKCKLFAFLKDKLLHRVNGWTSKWLSKAGKEVLIKSILLALPTYVMSSFLLPLKICDDLASAIARFWWSSNPPKKGMHWAKWDKMCMPRSEGGLGFRTIHEFNLALLAKQLWRLVQFPESLVARVLRGRYYRGSTPLKPGSVYNPSYVWTSLASAKELLCLGMRHKVHSGYEIRVWEDQWLPTIPARPPRTTAPVVNPQMLVSDLIDSNLGRWEETLLDHYVTPADIPLIKSLAISSSHKQDSYCWSYTKNGQYTVKSGYWVARNILNLRDDMEVSEPSFKHLQELAWKVRAPKKMCHLMWQLISGHVAVTSILNHRHMRCDNYCPRCGAPDETVEHAIFQCPHAFQVWLLSSTITTQANFPTESIYSNMDHLFLRQDVDGRDSGNKDTFPWLIWYIWKARNDKLFRGIDRDAQELVRHAESECAAWFSANDLNLRSNHQQEQHQHHISSRRNICMVDGSWTERNQFSGCGWIWKNANGDVQILGMKNLARREAALHTELESLIWAMECMLQLSSCQNFGTDCKDLIAMLEHPQEWPSFATELEKWETLKICFPSFTIVYIPREENTSADSLAKNVKNLDRPFKYYGCSVPVWFPRPPQV